MDQPVQHSEFVRGTWEGGFSGIGNVRTERMSIPISAPAEVGGSGEGASPSTLLVAAASGCYLLTLASILQRRQIQHTRLEIQSEGVFKGSAPPELAAVVHRPVVKLRAEAASREAGINQCFDLARLACIATKAMPNVRISVEGKTEVER